MNRTIFAAFLICLYAAVPAEAQTAPRPVSSPVKQLEKEKSEREEKRRALDEEANQITTELTDTKKQLVETADKIRQNESQLQTLGEKITAGQAERAEIEKRLKKEKGAIGDLVLALERINRTPPEAIIARPGAPLETAQSALLLQSILPDIYSRAENLKKDVAKLGEVIAALEQDQAEAKTASDALAVQQKDLNALLGKRKNLYDKNRNDVAVEEKELASISARAQNLKDLVARIEQRERQAEEERTARENARRIADEAREKDNDSKDEPQDEEESAPAIRTAARATPLPKDGSARLPISGMIRVGYRQTDDIGAESQGLTIEGIPGALVVSPMGGVVRYAGNFKGYGRIVIIEHQKDYHSLIAGLARIDTVAGQTVAAGEPVGTLAKTSRDGGKPALYYELRLKGEPVNPARKFAGL